MSRDIFILEAFALYASIKRWFLDVILYCDLWIDGEYFSSASFILIGETLKYNPTLIEANRFSRLYAPKRFVWTTNV